MASFTLGIIPMKVEFKAYSMDLEEWHSSSTSQMSCTRICLLGWKKFVVNPSRPKDFPEAMSLTVDYTSSKDMGFMRISFCYRETSLRMEFLIMWMVFSLCGSRSINR